MDSCIFCKIILGDIPSYKIYEDDDTMAFLDLYPSAPGHVVVIPKKHGRTVLDFDTEILGKLMGTVKTVCGGVERACNTGVLTIGINHGEPSGVPHLHVHVMPRYPDDGGGVIQSIVKNPPTESLEEIRKRIAGQIGKNTV